MLSFLSLLLPKKKFLLFCVKSIPSICEYICEVGVTMNTMYGGDGNSPSSLPSPLVKTRNPVVSLSPLSSLRGPKTDRTRRPANHHMIIVETNKAEPRHYYDDMLAEGNTRDVC
jgi:hypothetical protein